MRNTHKTTGWVKLLRAMAYVEIAAGCLLSVLLGIAVAFGSKTVGAGSVLVGLLVIAVGVLLSFVGAASIMVFLDLADDVRAIRAAGERTPPAGS